MSKQAMSTKVEIYNQHQYDEWMASKPDFAAVTDFRAYDLPGLTALPDMPAVTVLRAENLPGLTALPDLPAVTVFWADAHISAMRRKTSKRK